MTSDLETRLRTSIERQVSSVIPPPVDAFALARRGRRGKRTRIVGAISVTAAVVAVGVALSGSLVGGPAGREGRVLPSTGGPAIAAGGATGPAPVPGPRAVFVTRQKTYIDGTSYPVRLPWDTGAHVGRLGIAFPAPGSDRPSLLKRDGTVVRLAPAQPDLQNARYDAWVAADGNGSLVAWAENGADGAAVVVAYDTKTMTEVGRRTLPCDVPGTQTGCPRPYVVSDGIVFINTKGGIDAWDPAAGTSERIGSGDVQQAHNHVLTTFGGAVDTGAIGPEWEQAQEPSDHEGLLSYDGSWLLDANGSPKVISWRDPRESITYRPPGTVAEATFDTDGSVLVVTTTGDELSMDSQKNVRWTGWDCALGGACTQVVAPSTHEIRLVAWDT